MPLPLEDLLDRTRDALLAGDLAALATLAPEVETETDSLRPLPEADARRLRLKADRNARLLQSAARGLRAAQERLVQITTGPTLTTYDARGRKAVLSDAPNPVLRRF
ncbi:MAG: flagellar biosynthesis protein FlgN [Tabrizicola sp.]|jgi:hypothetical protein|nr:flagellar biosynthesis protein FlgN [Tabrizicola sp.]